MKTPTLAVAVAQPEIIRGDIQANANRHAAAIRFASARVVVFPELSLTGYELDAPAVALDDPALAGIVAACRETGTVALVGAPVADHGDLFIATLQVDGAGVRIAYRKTWLHGDENIRFSRGPGATTVDVDGWTIGLAICKDTGASQHTAQIARLDVDLYAAGVVDLPEDLVEGRARAFVISRAINAPVAVASFAGPTGGDFTRTAGHSAIHDGRGRLLAEADEHAGSIAVAVLRDDRGLARG